MNVRASAGSTSILGTQPTGAAGTTVSGPVVATLSGTSYTWFNVDFDSGTDGWVASIGLDRAYSVTPSAGTGGSVSPSATQTVKGGATKSFTVSPNSGYTRNSMVGGTCPLGSWSSNTWTTGAINANCTVSFSFLALLSAPSLSSPTSGATGISTTPTFSWSSVTGANRYWLTVATTSSALPTNPSVTSCPSCVITGSTGGTSHTLPATFSYPSPGTSVALSPGTTHYWRVQGWNSNGAQGNFSSIRSFTTASPTTYTVTPSAGAGGTVSPSTAQSVSAGAMMSFTVTPNSGYTRNSAVGGTCPQGSWSSNTWTTGAINANCTVSFSFTATTTADDHGNSTATATVVAAISSTAGRIEVAGDNDYFRINLTSGGTLTVATSGSTDTYGYLLDSGGNQLQADDDSAAPNFSISRSVSAGTYYVRVRHYSTTGTGAYTLVSTFSGAGVITVPTILVK